MLKAMLAMLKALLARLKAMLAMLNEIYIAIFRTGDIPRLIEKLHQFPVSQMKVSMDMQD